MGIDAYDAASSLGGLSLMTEPIEIAVVGSGYVGLVAAVCFAEMGHSVICVDNDERKVAALQAGDTLIHENHLPELLERYRNTRVRFMTDLGRSDAPLPGDLCRRGNSPVGDRGCRPVLRGGRCQRDRPLHQWLQGHHREEHGSGLHQRVDPPGDRAQRRSVAMPSMWSPIRSFCAKARRSRISCIRTASWWAPTASAPRSF